MAASTASGVMDLSRENRSELAARADGRPIASKTCDGSIDPTMQAEPLEAHTPSRSSAINRLSASEDGKVTFTVFDQVQDYTSSANWAGRVAAVLTRLHGDAVLQAGRIPTYGFHRHLLVLPTNGYTAKASNCFVRTYDSGMTDDHAVTGTMTMTFRVSALASNP